MTALQEDRKLLSLFLREVIGIRPPCRASELTVIEQQYPDEHELSEEEADRRGIPDGWIYRDAWCVFLESKLTARFAAEQIHRHRRTAARKGFTAITPVAITTMKQAALPDTVQLEWQHVYAWLRKHRSLSRWPSRAAEYLEIAEAKLIESERLREGTLTMFAGFPFGRDEPYSYLQGKRVLVLAMDELKRRRTLVKRLGVNLEASGRPAITGSHGEGVWDYLSLASSGIVESHTSYPHLTLSVRTRDIEAVLTIPNAVNSKMRRGLRELRHEGFQEKIAEVVSNLQPLLRQHPNATPCFRGIQRRYPSQRAEPYIDARIEFDLRTAVPQKRSAKLQPQWQRAAYEAFVDKRGSNYQMQIGVVFRYDRCMLDTPKALDAVADAWLACKPFVDLAR